jgi:photosystem II PsbU protein
MTKNFLKLLMWVFIGFISVIIFWFGFGLNQSAIAQLMMHKTAEIPYILSDIIRNPVEEKMGEVSFKIDLNNSNVMAFRRYRGLYPTLARKIIKNAPFHTVEEVLDIPELSDREIDVLKANLDNFVVTPSEPALIEGGDRVNPGIYR